MWPSDIVTNNTAAMAWITFACCISARPCSKFGKFRMNPVTLTTMPSSDTPPQNQAFSPALKRPDDTCWPENSPPNLANHCRSMALGRLSLTNVKNIRIVQNANTGPTKLWMYLDRVANHENSV